MGTKDWVRNKQTIEVGFYGIKDTRTKYETAALYYKAWNKSVGLPMFFLPLFSFVVTLFWTKFLNPFAHVNVSVHGCSFERTLGFSGWIESHKIHKTRFVKLVSIRLPVNKSPTYDELIELTNQFQPLVSSPLIMAYMFVMLIFPIRKLSYPKPNSDCVTSAEKILELYGITTKGCWSPSDLFNDLTKDKECQITWTSSKNLS